MAGGWRTLNGGTHPNDLAGGRHIHGGNEFGCRTLVIFKGAGFDVPSQGRVAHPKNPLIE